MPGDLCQFCVAFDLFERAAIEGHDAPDPVGECTCTPEPTIAMTLFAPDRLTSKPQRGTHVESTRSEFVQWLSNPVVTADKASSGGFALATLANGVRSSASVETVSALAFEHDAGTMSPELAHERLGRYWHVVYTTWSHTIAAPRWRAIVATSRPVSPEEHRIIWTRAAAAVERETTVDHAAKDACRLWYTPTVRPEGQHVVLVGDGAALDVDRVLANSRPRASAHVAPPRTTGDRYVAAALDSECTAVGTARNGARNRELNRAAYSLARLHISSDEIADALLAAARRAGLPDVEAKKTIASGINARRGRS